MSQAVQRLLQAVETFKIQSKGAELPEGAQAAVDGLQKALSQPEPGRDTPGAREALRLAPGAQHTGTGVPMKDAAKGPDQPSPGQREAEGVSAAISRAAAEIVASQQQ